MSSDLGRYNKYLQDSYKEELVEDEKFFVENPPVKEIQRTFPDEPTMTVGFWKFKDRIATCIKSANGYHRKNFQYYSVDLIHELASLLESVE